MARIKEVVCLQNPKILLESLFRQRGWEMEISLFFFEVRDSVKKTWRNAHEGKVTQLNSSLTEVWSKLFTRDKGNSGLTRQPT